MTIRATIRGVTIPAPPSRAIAAAIGATLRPTAQATPAAPDADAPAPSLGDTQRRVLHLMQSEQGKITSTRIAGKLGISVGAASSALSQLREKSLVRVTGAIAISAIGGGKANTWALTDAGRTTQAHGGPDDMTDETAIRDAVARINAAPSVGRGARWGMLHDDLPRRARPATPNAVCRALGHPNASNARRAALTARLDAMVSRGDPVSARILSGRQTVALFWVPQCS